MKQNGKENNSDQKISENDFANFYGEEIVNFALAIPANKLIKEYDFEAEKFSRICGTKVKIMVKITDEKITSIGHVFTLCSLGQAVAGAIFPYVAMLEITELHRLCKYVIKLVEENNKEIIPKKYENILPLTLINSYPSRWQSALLFPNALIDVINKYKNSL